MFYENFTKLCKEKGFSPTAALQELHISTSKLTAWKNGSMPNATFLLLISEFLDVSVDYLLTGKERVSCTLKLSESEEELLNNFKKLSDKSKWKLLGKAETLAEIEAEEKKKANTIEIHTNPGYIESYTLSASAGTGVDLDACEKIILEVKDSNLISEANFAIRISGDSMEPEFHNGQYALVKTKPQIEQGKIGIFTVNSNGYIKKLGAGELISLNPEYDNIPLHEYDNVRCRGEVIGTLEPEDIISKEEY